MQGLGLLALPIARRLLGSYAGPGVAFGKIIAILVVTWVAWVVGCLGVPYTAALWLSLIAFGATSVAIGMRDREAIGAWWRDGGARQLLILEALWTAGFFFFAWQRSLNPGIVDQEKYMDFAFYNTLLRTEVMPPQDPWMSGVVFNYYYFGYLMYANLARLIPFAASISYNLCVATIAATAFAEMCAVGWIVCKKLWFGILGGLMAMVFGNLDGFLQVVEQLSQKGKITEINFWRSSRVVAQGDTINEFPYFTSIHGDLHPHFLVMPVTILLLALLLDPLRLREPGEHGVRKFSDVLAYLPIAFVLGAMVAISTWELPVGAMTVGLLLHRYLPVQPLLSRGRISVVAMVGAIVASSFVFFLPFYLNFDAPQGGVGVKWATTSTAEFLTVFGGLLFAPTLLLSSFFRERVSLKAEARQLVGAIVLLAVAVALLSGKAVFVMMAALVGAALMAAYATDDHDERAPLLILLAGCAALLACELVFIKDPYGDKLYRMNTVFKLYLQAWLLLSVAAPWCLSRLLSGRGWLRSVAWIGGTAVIVASAIYPIGVTLTRTSNRFIPPTLDGNEYMTREHPDDFAAIEWLRKNVQGLPVILEASYHPYSYYARFSSNTGLPTVMGWANHEGLWRSHDEEVNKRVTDVQQIYNAKGLDEVTSLLDKYHVKYIAVGELERKDYKGVEKFASLPVAFTHGATTIYQR